MKKKKVAVAGVSLSKAYTLSKQHPLSEALSSLSKLGESGREFVKHACAQRAISSPSESFVSSGAKCWTSGLRYLKKGGGVELRYHNLFPQLKIIYLSIPVINSLNNEFLKY